MLLTEKHCGLYDFLITAFIFFIGNIILLLLFKYNFKHVLTINI